MTILFYLKFAFMFSLADFETRPDSYSELHRSILV